MFLVEQIFQVVLPALRTLRGVLSCKSAGRRAKAPAARRTAPDQLAGQGRRGHWLRPCGHCSRRLQGEGPVWHRHLTIQRVAAELFALAASELGIMVCRRVWRPSASPHRPRARTRSGAKGTVPLSV